jgi:hypothetical protein
MIARFLAVTSDGAASLHEHPLGIAAAVAETLRQGGFRIVWYPLEAAPPQPAAPPTGPTKAERRFARKEQARQFAELGR